MKDPTRRSVLRTSFGLAAAGALARPDIANAAATTAEMWKLDECSPDETEVLAVSTVCSCRGGFHR